MSSFDIFVSSWFTKIGSVWRRFPEFRALQGLAKAQTRRWHCGDCGWRRAGRRL